MLPEKMEKYSGRVIEGSRGRTRYNRYERTMTNWDGRMSKVGCIKLFISNLDKGVTENEVIELFGEFESFKSATLHYDRYNNSLGTAEVVYDRKRDAIKAKKEFNNRTLDGKVMEIAIYGLDRETALAKQPLSRKVRARMDNWSKDPKSRKNRIPSVTKEDKGGAMEGWGGARKRRRHFLRKEELKTEMKAKMWRNQRSRFHWKSNRNTRDKVRGGDNRSFDSNKNRKKLVRSKEDLDAELDAYMKGRSV